MTAARGVAGLFETADRRGAARRRAVDAGAGSGGIRGRRTRFLAAGYKTAAAVAGRARRAEGAHLAPLRAQPLLPRRASRSTRLRSRPTPTGCRRGRALRRRARRPRGRTTTGRRSSSSPPASGPMSSRSRSAAPSARSSSGSASAAAASGARSPRAPRRASDCGRQSTRSSSRARRPAATRARSTTTTTSRYRCSRCSIRSAGNRTAAHRGRRDRDRKRRRRALAAGAVAAQIGSALLLATEAGTSAPHREALARRRETRLTRAFTGRRARGIVNRFMLEHDAYAPRAYPEINYLTAPIRAAARELGDADGINLWAGTAYRRAREASARRARRALDTRPPRTRHRPIRLTAHRKIGGAGFEARRGSMSRGERLRGTRDDRARVACHDDLTMIPSGCGQLPPSSQCRFLLFTMGWAVGLPRSQSAHRCAFPETSVLVLCQTSATAALRLIERPAVHCGYLHMERMTRCLRDRRRPP